ncbi:hypothetical protein [Streptomyces sp.]|uniref:hypothetical protein n=1 Tax=Streptomyces sp. TaxID=1931 RepID=UPI002F3E7424
MRAAGHWWDAVRVPRHIGESVLTALGDASGAVIEDTSGALLYWLVEPGAASDWAFPAFSGVQIHGTAAHLAVPGPQRTAGPHWRIPPTPRRCLTPAVDLGETLRAAVDAVLGPRDGAVLGESR